MKVTTESTTEDVTTESTTEDATTESTSEEVTTLAAGCPTPFVASLNSSTGCYHLVPNDRVLLNWTRVEAECQRLDPRAHLISLDSGEVIHTIHVTCNTTLVPLVNA